MKPFEIYTYDEPILRRKLTEVTSFDEELLEFVERMHATMRGASGIGLAANQVGKDLRVLVVDLSDAEGYEGSEPLTVINPVIEAVSDVEETAEEGCLSLPELRADVTRPDAIQLRFTDPQMKEHTIEADDLLARVLQHEIDHLNGIYFFDRLPTIRRKLLKRRLMEIKRGEVDTDYPLFRS